MSRINFLATAIAALIALPRKLFGQYNDDIEIPYKGFSFWESDYGWIMSPHLGMNNHQGFTPHNYLYPGNTEPHIALLVMGRDGIMYMLADGIPCYAFDIINAGREYPGPKERE